MQIREVRGRLAHKSRAIFQVFSIKAPSSPDSSAPAILDPPNIPHCSNVCDGFGECAATEPSKAAYHDRYVTRPLNLIDAGSQKRTFDDQNELI
jgi:hypothetical protein